MKGMNGIVRGVRLVLLGALFINVVAGCYRYGELVDPCYPKRYSAMAAKEVKASLAPQVNNGRILDQTIWNYHFEQGSDKLTPGGLEHLAYIARRRPYPDCMVFLQTASLADLTYDYDGKNPDRLAEARAELDIKRKQAIQKFLIAQTVGQVAFQVTIHDPAEVGISAIAANSAVTKMNLTRFQGGLIQGGAGGGAGGGGGGVTGAGGAPGAVQTNPPGQ